MLHASNSPLQKKVIKPELCNDTDQRWSVTINDDQRCVSSLAKQSKNSFYLRKRAHNVSIPFFYRFSRTAFLRHQHFFLPSVSQMLHASNVFAKFYLFLCKKVIKPDFMSWHWLVIIGDQLTINENQWWSTKCFYSLAQQKQLFSSIFQGKVNAKILVYEFYQFNHLIIVDYSCV